MYYGFPSKADGIIQSESAFKFLAIFPGCCTKKAQQLLQFFMK